MTALRACSLALCLLTAASARATTGVIVFGDDAEAGLKAEWIKGLKFSYEFLKQRLGDGKVHVYFNGTEHDVAGAGMAHAAHLQRNPATDTSTAAIVQLANADDVVLIVYGHGIIGSGAIDMTGAKNNH